MRDHSSSIGGFGSALSQSRLGILLFHSSPTEPESAESNGIILEPLKANSKNWEESKEWLAERLIGDKAGKLSESSILSRKIKVALSIILIAISWEKSTEIHANFTRSYLKNRKKQN